MATHGRTGLAHLVFGSVAEAVLAGTDVLVLLVHSQPNEPAGVPFDPSEARVLVPVDDSEMSAAALLVAGTLLR